jgi:hypothetical protein
MRLVLVTLSLVVMSTALPLAAAGPAPIAFTRQQFSTGVLNNSVVDGDRLTLAVGQTSGSWTSTQVDPDFGFTRLVASWNADTPGASQVRIEVQAATQSGQTDWYTLGVWAASDHAVQRTSVRGQNDTVGQIETDTLVARNSPFVSYTLRTTLERATADDPSPSVRMLGAQVSDTSYVSGTATSAPLGGEAIELAVPSYSQEVHARQYPQYGGGGEAWCSPTSTEMVVEYWGRGPSADDLAWVNPAYADPSVDFAARWTYDAAYRGTGNWPFNTAYAARYGLDAFVTQLRSLAEAEMFIGAGIPLVASIASGPQELQGFLFDGGTNGHLVVIVGFDAAGNPLVNDPAAWTNDTVRRFYDRAQFERVWLRGSAGTVYVIHPPEIALPPPRVDASANW